MPHLNIKFFPVELSEEEQQNLVNKLSETISETFKCAPEVISIALEPIEKEKWQDTVYQPEIMDRSELLCKIPNY